MTKDLVTDRLKLKDIHPGWAKELAEENKIDVDDLELVRKGFIADKTETDEDGVISFISMEGLDRDNEEIDPDGAILSFFNKNKVVPYGHDYRGLPVGKNMWIKKATKNNKKGLLAKTVFLKHNFAQEVGRLYTEDVAGTGPAMNGWSIGFIPLKWEEPEEKGKPPKEGEADTRPRRKYTKWELLEYSAVMIPSNREALTEMVEKGLIKSDKLKKEIEQFIEIEDDLTKHVCPQCGEEKVEIDGYRWCRNCDPPEILYGTDFVEEHAKEIAELITKPEETDDYIRLPVKGEEGKHKNHKIRWITVSAKEGIRGIYCIDCKKIITFVFDKAKGWTMEKAKKWMEDHGKLMEAVVNRWNDIMPEDKNDQIWEYLEHLIELALEGKYTPPDKAIEDNFKVKYNCECIECGHKLTSDKHCKDLKCPKCGGQMRRVERPGPGQESLNREVIELEDEIKGVIPYRETPKAPEGEKWDGAREVREAEVSDLKIMCCWFDSENPDIKGSYKLPHHKAKGHAVVWKGVANSMAVLFGARGGVDVPGGDRKGIFGHLSKHYKQFDKEPPEFREYSEDDLKHWDELYRDKDGIVHAAIDDSWLDTLKELGNPEGLFEMFPELYKEKQIMTVSDAVEEQYQLLRQEIATLKEGRVLSEKNRKLINDVLAGMEAAIPPLRSLLTATEPPKREEIEIDIEKDDNGQDAGRNDGKLDIDTDKLTGIIQEALKSNIDKINEIIEDRIAKSRGKVE